VENVPTDTDASIARAAALITDAEALLVTAGAGMGIDSGLPDFRGPGGFWGAYPGLGRRRIEFTDIASPDAFEAVPRVAWGFYGHRLALYRATVPHDGFRIVRSWGERMRHGLRVFTSNVDGQFEKAGVPPPHVTACHGSIHNLECLDDCGHGVWHADALVPDINEHACEWRGPLPTCPGCGGLARPNILMFYDSGWDGRRYEAAEMALRQWLDRTPRLVVVEIGAGTAIPSVRRFGEATRAPLIRINPREGGVVRGMDVSVRAGALAALRAIDDAMA
jgi:NAD-dependent SIR2 family protein deacetylase